MTEAASPVAATEHPGGPPLRAVIGVLAFACGACVANIYYSQPLLGLIARSFAVSEGTATLVVTVTQVGYALGLLLLLPLGDLLENRALASRSLVLTAAALAAAAVAPGLGVFLAASVLIGVTSVVAQVLVPLAAHLAPPRARGMVVGQVMSGLLLGIMLARSVASFAAAAWGWRSIYAISAVLMLVTAGALVAVLPRRRPEHRAGYRALLASSVELVRTEPLLMRRAATQACMFAAFTAYWTAIAYELVGAHGLSQDQVALFALIGASGAAAAPLAGRLGDRGWGRPGRLVAITVGLAALLLARWGATSLVLLALAGVLLDLAVQGHQVLSQRDIYGLRPDARARVTSVYTTSIFAAGAASSALTGLVHDRWGWTGVASYATALPLVAAAVWLGERRRTSV